MAKTIIEIIVYLIAITVTLCLYALPILIIILIIKKLNKHFRNVAQDKIREARRKNQRNKTRITNPQWEKVIMPDGTEFYKLKRSGDFDIEQQKRMNELIAMQKLPYSKKNLLTPTEYRFWTELKAVCDTKSFLICPKVRMEDFIQVNLSSYTEKQRYRGKIKSRHIDFMLCDNKLKILAGIELDDKSHNKEEAQKNDEFKNQVFFNLGLPLYRVKVKSENYAAEIEQIMNDIEKSKKTTDHIDN